MKHENDKTDSKAKHNGKINNKKKPKVKVFDNKKPRNSVQELISKYDSINEDVIKTFNDFPLSSETKKGLKDANYKVPTEIQKRSIGLALQGKDILGAALTGSGKTLAFLIPVLEKLYCEKWCRAFGVGAIIITPTRELAKQIFETLRDIGRYHNFSAGLVIGGKDRKTETTVMDQCNIVICTPGRLLDHMDNNVRFDCSNMQILVLDEADRCLDMGFQRDMNNIIEHLPPERQTLLFSATQTKSVKDLARLSLKDPSYVAVHENLKHSTPESLKQIYMVCELKDKVSLIWSFIRNHWQQKTIIFLTSCKQVKYMVEIFSKIPLRTTLMGLYGSLHQLRRHDIYDSFCRKPAGVLFATDLAARGLDFPGVHWVVQADCPEDATAYIHRVGRTARYHKDGQALLMLLPSELPILENLKEKKIPIEKVEVDSSKRSDPTQDIQKFVSRSSELRESAQRAFISYVKSIVLMKDKKVFDIQTLDTDSFAYSLGLQKPPRLRFLQRRNLKTGSEPTGTAQSNQVAQTFQEEPEDSEEEEEVFWTEKRDLEHSYGREDDSIVEITSEKNKKHSYGREDDSIVETTFEKKKKSKPVTREALAKKMLKNKKTLPNKKIIFPDDIDVIKEDAPADIESTHEETEVSHFQKMIQCRHQEEHKLHRQKVKLRHQEHKKKLKAMKNQQSDEEDEFSGEDDGEEPDLSWLPDPDNVYGSSGEHQHTDQKYQESDEVEDEADEEEYNDEDGADEAEDNNEDEAYEKRDKSEKTNKNNKRKTEDDDSSPKKKKSKKKNKKESLGELVNEAEELALLLLKENM